MGSEHLRQLRSFVFALGVATAACGGANRVPETTRSDKSSSRHAQIFHAMKTADRQALVARLRERNSPTSRWTVNEEALALSLTVVDPFSGFLRRAKREPFVRPPRAGGPITEADAAASAREFVKRNADLLGLPRHLVSGLFEHVRAVEPSDHAQVRALWAVRFEAPFSTKGYEGFKEIDNTADLEVLVDDDGEVSSFVNVSRIHPHLMIDTKPGLAQEDPRVLAKLVGRKVFALEIAGGHEARDVDVQALHRIQLGELSAADVTRMQLVIHVSPGPQLAWLTYRLAYFVELAKVTPPSTMDDTIPPDPSQFFFFRYVVDADTGEVLEDARAPFVGSVRQDAP